MEKEIKQICTELNDGKIAVVQATEKLLDLFSVVGQSEQCVLHSTDWNGKCFKCGEQVFVREEK